MIRKLYILFILLLGFVHQGCTHNNGDIGDLFGTWRLESMTADGEELDLYSNLTQLYTWAFQSHIIRIQDIRNNMDHSNCFGTWMQNDDELILNFTHENDNGNNGFLPPTPLHFETDGITKLTINRLSSKRLQTSYRNSDGIEYMYYLRKVP